MIRKPKRNFRNLRQGADSDTEDNDEDSHSSQAVADFKAKKTDMSKSKTQNWSKKESNNDAVESNKSSNVISFQSFDDEIDAEQVFQIKKSNLSKKIAKKLKKQKHEDLKKKCEIPTVVNGEYPSDLSEEEDEHAGDKFQSILEGGAIPDANMIHAARKKRQMQREMGDYIPLETNKPPDSANGNSRLIREDDGGSEEEEPVSFMVTSRQQEVQKIRDTIQAVEQGSDIESDHERDWEAQQISKAVNFFQAPPVARDIPTDPSAAPDLTSLPPIDLETCQKLLHRRLADDEATYGVHMNEHRDLKSQLSLSQEAIDSSQGSKNHLELTYKFYQEMRGYVRDLVACLNEKVSEIQYQDRRWVGVIRERSQKILERRKQDLVDQIEDHKSDKVPLNVPSSDVQRQRRLAEREARRSRRRRAREGANMGENHKDGWSTDDELSQSEVKKYLNDREDVIRVSQSIFTDVLDDFSLINKISEHFEAWKHEYRSSYDEAYIGLCLPKLFTPFVQLDLIGWNPLHRNAVKMEFLPWFDSLVMFDRKSQCKRDDADVLLIPVIVEKVIVPKLTDIVETVWDPLSSEETIRLIAFVKKLFQDYPTIHMNSKSTQKLLKEVVSRYSKAINEDIFIPIYAKEIINSKNHPSCLFFHRQLWSALKLMNYMLSWDSILSDVQLLDLAINTLLNRYILMGLSTLPPDQDTIDKCSLIKNCMPRSWFESCSVESTIKPLQMFAFFLSGIAKNAVLGNAVNVRDLQRQIVKILTSINANDHADKIIALQKF